jgi:hypothetical protein
MLRKLSLLLTVIVAAVAWAKAGHAQATRSWVSGVGDDANPCSRTAPCKTFAGAVSKTATSGEINCLDPGGFGAITITKSITLDCHEVYASILVAGTPGITINAAGAVVTIRNLNLDGVTTGTRGINILAASRVNIEDVMIMEFTQQGIADVRTGGGNFLSIRNTTIRDNAGAGVVAGAGATSGATIENCLFVANGFGLATATGNKVVVSRSIISANTTAGIEADAGGQVFVDNTVISHNGTGVQADGTIILGNSDIAFNTTGITGATTSFGNNRIFGNSAPGTTPTVGAATTDHGQE